MTVSDAFDYAIGGVGLVSFLMQLKTFRKSAELAPLAEKWAGVSKFLVCEVRPVLESNREVLGFEYARFQKDYDRLQDSIHKRERGAKNLDKSKMSEETRLAEEKRIQRAYTKAADFKNDIITTSRDKRGDSWDTISFTESIGDSAPLRPSMCARVFSGGSRQPPTDEESSPSSGGDVQNGSVSSGSPPPGSDENYATPTGVDDQAISMGCLDTGITVNQTESGLEFNITNSKNETETFTDKDILRNAGSLPAETIIPIIAFSHKVATLYPINERDRSHVLRNSRRSNAGYRNWSASLPNLHDEAIADL